MLLIHKDTKNTISSTEFVRLYSHLSLPAQLTNEVYASFGYAPLNIVPSPTVAWNQRAVIQEPALTNKGFYEQNWVVETINFTAEELTAKVEAMKKEKMDQLATARYNKEVGGVELNGSKIKTDRESQAQLNNAFTALKNSMVSTVQWKADGSWVELTIGDVAAIAGAVAAHVQYCFVKEKQKQDEITACTTVEQLMSLDLDI